MIRPIKGYEGKYAVSFDGYVYSLNYHRTGFMKILKAKYDKDGYLEVGLYNNRKKKYYRVHRLIALAFVPNPKKFPQVNHKDGVKDNNWFSNLEWVTSSENIKHSFTVLGKSQKGEKNNASKLTNSIVAEIWKLKNKKTQKEIAMLYNTTDDTVGMIHRQVNWKWLTDKL